MNGATLATVMLFAITFPVWSGRAEEISGTYVGAEKSLYLEQLDAAVVLLTCGSRAKVQSLKRRTLSQLEKFFNEHEEFKVDFDRDGDADNVFGRVHGRDSYCSRDEDDCAIVKQKKLIVLTKYQGGRETTKFSGSKGSSGVCDVTSW